MKSCREIRAESWSLLRGKWFFRLLLVGLVLQTIASTVNGIVVTAYSTMSITPLSDFVAKKAAALAQGMDYALPTSRAYAWMYGGFAFQMFLAYLFAAIFAFGFMHTLLKASARDDDRWFAESFGGFMRPFEVTWLLVVMNLKIFLWSLLFIIPGLVAMYRYRQAWFIMNERPETSVCGCLAESGKMMRGHKAEAFALDCSFIGWLLLAGALVCTGAVGASIGSGALGLICHAFGFGIGIFGFYLVVKVVLGIAVSRVIFYRSLCSADVASAPSAVE